MSKLSRLSILGLAKEVTQGTAVTPTVYFPFSSIETEDIIAPIRDESYRANDTILQGQYGGSSESTVGHGGAVYPDTIGHLLRAILGLDTVGALVGGLYPHTFKANNAQCPSYTLTDYDGVGARAYPGCMLSELGIDIDAKGEVSFDAKWAGWPGAPAATPTPSYTALQPFLGWQLTWSANAVASTRVQNCKLSFKRDVDVLQGSDGTQAPRETFQAALEFTASATLLFEDATDRDRFLTYAQQALVISLVQPAGNGGASLALTATKASWRKAKLGRGEKYVTLEAEIDGVYNATDAGPCAVVLTNPESTAY